MSGLVREIVALFREREKRSWRLWEVKCAHEITLGVRSSSQACLGREAGSVAGVPLQGPPGHQLPHLGWRLSTGPQRGGRCRAHRVRGEPGDKGPSPTCALCRVVSQVCVPPRRSQRQAGGPRSGQLQDRLGGPAYPAPGRPGAEAPALGFKKPGPAAPRLEILRAGWPRAHGPRRSPRPRRRERPSRVLAGV